MRSSTNNQSITKEHLSFVEVVAAFVARPEINAAFRSAEERALEALRADAASTAKVEAVDINQFSNQPAGIGSIRVAVIREGFDGGYERHPNSTQYLYSLSGTGETHVKTESGWRIDNYGAGDRLEDRFHVVPLGAWHKSAAPGPGTWSVVALHTAVVVEDDHEYKD